MDHQLTTEYTAEKMRLSFSYILSFLLVLLYGSALVSARPQNPCGPPPNGPPPSGPPPSGPPTGGPPPGGRCLPMSTTPASG